MSRLGLFEGIGVEIEYMIIDQDSLDVRPVCDRLIESMVGSPAAEFERGDIAWSNELVLHVLELKTNGPAADLTGLRKAVHREVLAAREALDDMGCTLLPGGVHPWMDPARETELWPHEYNEVYRTFDRIFGCSGHGWSNLQSTHVNLPFDGDEEFGRLHAAIRTVLPLIPGLAAGSPFLDGARQDVLDARMEVYRTNSRRIPEMAGDVVPIPVRSEGEYRDRVLAPLFDALEPHDEAGVLRHEWANARGAIARFERGAIEIRIIDAQESPSADLAIVALIVGAVRALAEERWTASKDLDRIETTSLVALFRDTIRDGGDATVIDRALLGALGSRGGETTAARLWQELADRVAPDLVPAEYGATLEAILSSGTLASRMVAAHGDGASLRDIASSLEGCLRDDTIFEP